MMLLVRYMCSLVATFVITTPQSMCEMCHVLLLTVTIRVFLHLLTCSWHYWVILTLLIFSSTFVFCTALDLAPHTVNCEFSTPARVVMQRHTASTHLLSWVLIVLIKSVRVHPIIDAVVNGPVTCGMHLCSIVHLCSFSLYLIAAITINFFY